MRLVEGGRSIAGAARSLGLVDQTLFGSWKLERLHVPRFTTRRQAMDEVVAWVFWHKRTRLHSTLTDVSPMRLAEDRHAKQPRLASA